VDLEPRRFEAEQEVDLDALEQRSARPVDDDEEPAVLEGDFVSRLPLVELHPVGQARASPALDVQAQGGPGLPLLLHDLQHLVPRGGSDFDRYHRALSDVPARAWVKSVANGRES